MPDVGSSALSRHPEDPSVPIDDRGIGFRVATVDGEDGCGSPW
jgi:hypothetical protein